MPIVEGGRLLWRAVRAIVAPQPEAPVAEADLAEALAESAPPLHRAETVTLPPEMPPLRS